MEDMKQDLPEPLSYTFHPSSREYQRHILPHYLDRGVKVHPEREAAVIYKSDGERTRLTFKQYQSQSIKLAAGLLRSGLTHGDRVLLVAPNSLEFIVIQMACARIGVFLLLLKFGASSEEVLQELTYYKCQAIMVQSCESRPGYAQGVVKALQQKDQGQGVESVLAVCVSFGGGQNTISYDAVMGPNPNHISAEEKDAVATAQSRVQMEDLLLGMMTSGSTGRPKAVTMTHFQFIQATFTAAEITRLEDGSRLLNERPFTWAGGVGFGINFMAVTGITLVSMDPEISVKKADTDLVKKILQDERCTHLLAMPYMMYDFISSKDFHSYDLSHLKYAITGGQPILQESAVSFVEKNPSLTLVQVFGSAEFILTFRQMTNSSNVKRPDFGFLTICSGVEAKVVDDNDRLVPKGTVGELCVRGPSVFSGYLDNPEATARALTPLRWYKTGDMMVMNDQGQVRFVGRKSDIIKRATVKVQPAEVEEVLVRHPKIVQAYVVGVPDARFYEELCACVQFHDDANPVEEQLQELETWCGESFLPGPDGLTLAPRYFLAFQNFPRTGNGKINRRELRAMAVKRLELS
ncbi:acyl-CoA synthetase family member 2, mitochondrial [Lingula anatina]|uniref:Acyl-CoA synthetase family member 2, mitochondrial n=1 Tax=Lingula anatina TaxID=7574 RepID=A0A1S3GZY1_LINAN|nr:acyl-CoA synthetase family member 2, mitochondrial [Lingula anatina]|eukprot:XP_013378791.1 acyl-CoA synthetase family member 2, mitochondrial [Lingula anatina]